MMNTPYFAATLDCGSRQETEGEYQKVAELPKKPSGDELDAILIGGQTENTNDATPVRKPSVFKSLQRFIKALSS